LGLRDLDRRGAVRMVISVFPLALLLVSLASTLSAQESASGGLDSASILLLKPDRFVRIQLPELGRVQGKVGSRVGEALTLKSEEGDRRVRLAAVDTLWVRGRATKLGAIVGGVLGLGSGLLLGALGDALCEYDCGGNYALTGGLLGAAVGGATGAVIGSAIPRWRRVFPR
jgi:hypothetical protein